MLQPTTPSPTATEEITQLLLAWGQGDQAALEQLLPLVYEEMRQIAHHHMRRQRPDHTLQTTALVNEAYLRLVDAQRVQWQNRVHFFALAAQAMRHILVDLARARGNQKRGGGATQVALEEALIVSAERGADVLALDEALAKLLRNGKTTLDYTNTFAFSTTKPISVNGAASGTYSNLYTTTALTSINLGSVVQQMMGRLNEDGLSLGLMPDTLIVPPTLYQAAQIAVNMKSIVFSGTAGVGNLAPGQANNTAAQGDNWVAYSGLIKQVLVMPELIGSGSQVADQTTWYVAEAMNDVHGGPVGLLLAADPGFELLTNLSPSDPEVFYRNRYAWGMERYIGTAFGVTSFLSRCEA